MADIFPVLHTPRFLLRHISGADVGQVFRGLSHPQVTAYYGISYTSQEATQAQIDWYQELLDQQTGIWWGICLQETPGELLGACGFYEWNKDNRNTDMGYWLLPEHWGSGAMQECLHAILQHAFSQMHLHRVEAEVEPENTPSSRLLLKLGFQLEGTRRQCEWKNGHFVDLEYYSLLASELK
ncbi:GNAT family N-acetyltransferase [Undibacterium terreum]|uniref:N-acetyltransferase n=1 Tax=Undibacterium terreum TaxID=1224302 RepID=A0A916UFU8_9BURK|nr:GNAT family protein [Undibacterium terreum]GGC70734.1 N-acetyltransferase [Undibacterium terreum]